MPRKSWTWTQRTEGIYVAQARLTPNMVGGPRTGYQIDKQRLKGGLSDGVDIIHVNNGLLSFDVLPTRGMGIWRARVGDLSLGWNSPVPGPVHPNLVPLAEPSGLGWLDGFDELLVRCGLESNGAPEFTEQGQLRYGLHGRIANKPAHQVQIHADGESGDLTVAGVVDEVRFHFCKLRLFSSVSTRVSQAALQIRDTVENLSASPTDIQLLYHINFGPPLLGPGARVVAPVQTLVPRTPLAAAELPQWDTYPPPRAGTSEQVYFVQLHSDDQQQTAVLLHDATASRGVSLHYSPRQLPCFTLWKNPTAEADGYVTGLEPGTNYPNPRSFEASQGRVVTLGPGETATFDIEMRVHCNPDDVRQARDYITALQSAAPVIYPQPQPLWCADV